MKQAVATRAVGAPLGFLPTPGHPTRLWEFGPKRASHLLELPSPLSALKDPQELGHEGSIGRQLIDTSALVFGSKLALAELEGRGLTSACGAWLLTHSALKKSERAQRGPGGADNEEEEEDEEVEMAGVSVERSVNLAEATRIAQMIHRIQRMRSAQRRLKQVSAALCDAS